ncbi:MAG: hypothetical protein PUF50_05885 [Erysipelotrichaceae bacterium]|nr:hypothetical protein [Erysipelotrichaceae bacterium]
MVPFIIISCTGCSKKVEYYEEYGVQYSLDDETFIRINLDPKDSKTITKFWIVSSNNFMRDGNGMENYPSEESEDYAIEYVRTDSQESIVVRFYVDLQKENLVALNQYVGYTFSMKTDINDLLESDTFEYKKILMKEYF